MTAQDSPRDGNFVPAALFQIDGAARGQLMPGQIDQSTGRILVDDAGGVSSTLTQETPTGTVDGSNNVFTVLNTPVFVVVDGQTRPLVASINDINGNGFTYSAGTLTVNSLVPPVSFIRSYYNS